MSRLVKSLVAVSAFVAVVSVAGWFGRGHRQTLIESQADAGRPCAYYFNGVHGPYGIVPFSFSVQCTSNHLTHTWANWTDTLTLCGRGDVISWQYSDGVCCSMGGNGLPYQVGTFIYINAMGVPCCGSELLSHDTVKGGCYLCTSNFCSNESADLTWVTVAVMVCNDGQGCNQ